MLCHLEINTALYIQYENKQSFEGKHRHTIFIAHSTTENIAHTTTKNYTSSTFLSMGARVYFRCRVMGKIPLRLERSKQNKLYTNCRQLDGVYAGGGMGDGTDGNFNGQNSSCKNNKHVFGVYVSFTTKFGPSKLNTNSVVSTSI